MVACLLFPILLLNKTVVYDGYFKFGLPQFMPPLASIVQFNPTSLPTSTIDSTTVSSELPVPSPSEKNYSFEHLVPYTLAHPDVYAILSSDIDFNYLFPLPLVILSWRRIGVNSIVILIGTREEFETNTKLAFILRTIEQMNVQVFFMSSKMTSTFTLAQTARLFVAGFAGLKLNDTDILITADADMFSFIYEEHVPDVSKGKQVFLYNSRCCGLQFRRGSRHLHIPMNTIATTVRLWREIMLIAPDSVTTGDDIVRRLNSEFSPALLTGPGRKANGDEKWSIDQKLISTLFHEWNISRYLTRDHFEIISVLIYSWLHAITKNSWHPCHLMD